MNILKTKIQGTNAFRPTRPFSVIQLYKIRNKNKNKNKNKKNCYKGHNCQDGNAKRFYYHLDS